MPFLVTVFGGYVRAGWRWRALVHVEADGIVSSWRRGLRHTSVLGPRCLARSSLPPTRFSTFPEEA